MGHTNIVTIPPLPPPPGDPSAITAIGCDKDTCCAIL